MNRIKRGGGGPVRVWTVQRRGAELTVDTPAGAVAPDTLTMVCVAHKQTVHSADMRLEAPGGEPDCGAKFVARSSKPKHVAVLSCKTADETLQFVAGRTLESYYENADCLTGGGLRFPAPDEMPAAAKERPPEDPLLAIPD